MKVMVQNRSFLEFFSLGIFSIFWIKGKLASRASSSKSCSTNKIQPPTPTIICIGQSNDSILKIRSFLLRLRVKKRKKVFWEKNFFYVNLRKIPANSWKWRWPEKLSIFRSVKKSVEPCTTVVSDLAPRISFSKTPLPAGQIQFLLMMSQIYTGDVWHVDGSWNFV